MASKIIRNYNDLVDVFKKLKNKVEKEPLMLSVENLYNKRSHKQLRSYWLLVKVVKLWMNEKGNNYTDEEISYYFKIKSGFYNELDGVKLAKSISDKSTTTKQNMEQLINTILDFGVENEIKDCRIDSYELQELLKYYEE